jgi:hypothetical protein
MMFAPEICLPTIRYMHDNFAQCVYGRYGFADAFNPQTLRVDPDVVGIDVGITLLSAENLHSSSIWHRFQRSPALQPTTQRLFQPFPSNRAQQAQGGWERQSPKGKRS